MKKIAELISVSAGYHDNIILHNVTLPVYQNDFLGIIGPNGGGKTTILKILLGSVTPVKGEIIFYPDNLRTTLAHDGSEKLQNKNSGVVLGYLPQNSMIDKKFPVSVIDVVLSGLNIKKRFLERYSRSDVEEADRIIKKFGISGERDTHIAELSGGQLQRVFLSRAMISAPDILLLDEPDSFVDERMKKTLYDILKEINKDTAIVLVSHDAGVISSYVKNIACVNNSLEYHPSGELTKGILENYACPIDVITHGKVPHRVLHEHIYHEI